MTPTPEQPPTIIRPPRDDEVAAVTALLNACDVAEYGAPDTIEEDVATDWRREEFSLANDAWVAQGAAGRLVGYAYAGDQSRNGEIQGDLFVHPASDGPAVARRLLDLVERRAAELVAERGYRESPRLAVYCSTVNVAKRALLAHDGFAVVRSLFRMQIDLSLGHRRLEPPPGIAIRTFRAGIDDQAMYDGMYEAFADHFHRRRETLDQWRTRLMKRGDFDPSLWLLARDGEQVAGTLIAYDFGDLGWVQGLGVRRPWRGRGLGGALLSRAFDAFIKRDQPRAALGVDAQGETGALRVYERAGMQATRQHDLFELAL
jgi:mycothiol synthase